MAALTLYKLPTEVANTFLTDGFQGCFPGPVAPIRNCDNSSKLKCQLPTDVISKDTKRQSNYIKAHFKISWATKLV